MVKNIVFWKALCDVHLVHIVIIFTYLLKEILKAPLREIWPVYKPIDSILSEGKLTYRFSAFPSKILAGLLKALNFKFRWQSKGPRRAKQSGDTRNRMGLLLQGFKRYFIVWKYK